MLLAGEDTTANTLAWMLYLLHRHPAALQRAQQEVRERAPDAAAFTPEIMASLDYLEAFRFEADDLAYLGEQRSADGTAFACPRAWACGA